MRPVRDTKAGRLLASALAGVAVAIGERQDLGETEDVMASMIFDCLTDDDLRAIIRAARGLPPKRRRA